MRNRRLRAVSPLRDEEMCEGMPMNEQTMQRSMVRWSRVLAVALMVAIAAGASFASDEPVDIEIALPAGGLADVAYQPGIGEASLVLPQGARYPLDIREASGGMIHGGEVVPLDDGKMKLTLALSTGTIQEIRFEPDAVIVRIGKRFMGANDTLDGLTEQSRYKLGAYDRLNLTIYNHPDLSGEISVSRDGRITAPFIGEVVAAGKTTRELAEELTARLGREYLVDPEIDISVEKFRSQWVMVNGEVRNPGRIFLTGGTTLKEAISDANGFVETSGAEIIISRESEEGTEMERIDRAAFENGEVNPVVQHGDIVTVKPLEFAFMQGEVRNPTRVRIEYGLTLMQAISLSSGMTEWANRKSVKILPGNGGQPTIINLRDIERGKVPDPELRGGDVVVIPRRFF